MLEYKVLTERDTKFTGKFDAESLEAALNSYAADGWRVVEGVLAANVAKSAQAQIFVILERERPAG
jgi:hypothetical protein